MITDKISYSADAEGVWLKIKITKKFLAAFFEHYKEDKKYSVEIKEHREKRSLDANAYCWVLCGKIAEKHEKLTGKDIYKHAISEIASKVGAYETVCILAEAVEHFESVWCSGREGNQIIKLTNSKEHDGFVWVICAYGSSDYDTKQMSVLIDYLVDEAHELGIKTETPEQIDNIKSLWREHE